MQNRNRGKKKAVLGLSTSVVVLGVLASCSPQSSPPVVDEAIFASYPQEGDTTSYGMTLSMSNGPTFLQYHEQYTLTAEQEAIKYEALTPLVAPCCDDNPMYTCCCPCNLAKTVWGLSAYLIVEKNYDATAVREAAFQWLRFIRRDYYKVHELQEQGLDPRAFGLTHVNSCYEGRCDLPFRQGGCGGMSGPIVEE